MSAPGGLTYDTGALVAAQRNDRLLWSLHRAAVARGLPPTVPAGVLAEAWRGGSQHRLSQVLKGCAIEVLGEDQARDVGVMAGRSGLSDTVDLAVAEGALRRNDAVVTSNRTDIERAGDAVRRRLVLHSV